MYTPENPSLKLVTFGKHKGKTFAEAYAMKHYVKWVLDVENATGRLRELQEYFADNEGIVLPPAPKKIYQRNGIWTVAKPKSFSVLPKPGPPQFIGCHEFTY